jgi:ankyrin repeat protein
MENQTFFRLCETNNAKGLAEYIRVHGKECVHERSKLRHDPLGWTGMHYAAYSNALSCIKILMENGAAINAKSTWEITPEHILALQEDKEHYPMLENYWDNVYETGDIGGQTPLHYAVFEELKECVALLLQLGADPSIKNNEGKTMLDCVKDEAWRKEIEEMLEERA